MGAGQSQSLSTSQTVTNIATDVIMKHSLECIISANQSQLIEVKNISGDVTFDGSKLSQGSSLDVKCMMSLDKQTNMTNDISTALSQYAEAKGETVLSALGGSSAKIKNDLITEFKNSLQDLSETSFINTLTQNQEIKVANVGGDVVMKDITMDQQAKMVAETLLQSKAYHDVINSFASKVDQVAIKEDVNPIKNVLGGIGGVVKDTGSALGNLFSSPGTIVVVVVLLILAAGGLGFFLYMRQDLTKTALTAVPSLAAAAPNLAAAAPNLTTMAPSLAAAASKLK